MEYNRATLLDFDTWQNTAMDNAGWTQDEKDNGKLDSCDYDPNTGGVISDETGAKKVNGKFIMLKNLFFLLRKSLFRQK